MCSAGKAMSSTAHAEAPAKKQRQVRRSAKSMLAALTWVSVHERSFTSSQQESRPRKTQRHLKAAGIASRQHAASGKFLSEVQSPERHQPDPRWIVQPAIATSGTHSRGNHRGQAPSMSSTEQPDMVHGPSVEHPMNHLKLRNQHGKAMSRWGDFQDDEASADLHHDAGIAIDRNIEKSAPSKWLTNPCMQQSSSLQQSIPQLTTSYD